MEGGDGLGQEIWVLCLNEIVRCVAGREREEKVNKNRNTLLTIYF